MPSPAPARRRWRPTAPAAGALALVTVLLALTGCSVRLDTPPDPVPTPDAAESLRAELAESTETLITLAHAAAEDTARENAGEDGNTATAELIALADASTAHLEALGGIWTPPPRPEDPSPTPAPEITATPEDVLTALTEAATGVQEALAEPLWEPEAATLLASIALYRDGALTRLASALGTEPPARPEPDGHLPEQLDATTAPLCRTLDALGYAYEVQAARSSGDLRERAATRAEQRRALAEQVAVLAGYDGTADDPRQASYAVGEDLGETIARWQAELVPAWLALIGPAEAADRATLLTWARAAADLAPPPANEPFPGLQTG